jgi:hypothetical protein
MSTKKCSKCETAFECSSEKDGCWCEEVYIDLSALEAIKELYDNCLCPPCLKEYSVVSEK